MHENCDRCSQDYEFTKENARLNLFIEDPLCNHIAATCPHCGGEERIFVAPDIAVHVMQECQLGLGLAARADDSLRASAAKTWETLEVAFEPPETFALTDRQERLLSVFEAAMEAIPTELFWVFIEDDTNHPYNERWV